MEPEEIPDKLLFAGHLEVRQPVEGAEVKELRRSGLHSLNLPGVEEVQHVLQSVATQNQNRIGVN